MDPVTGVTATTGAARVAAEVGIEHMLTGLFSVSVVVALSLLFLVVRGVLAMFRRGQAASIGSEARTQESELDRGKRDQTAVLAILAKQQELLASTVTTVLDAGIARLEHGDGNGGPSMTKMSRALAEIREEQAQEQQQSRADRQLLHKELSDFREESALDRKELHTELAEVHGLVDKLPCVEELVHDADEWVHRIAKACPNCPDHPLPPGAPA